MQRAARQTAAEHVIQGRNAKREGARTIGKSGRLLQRLELLA